MSEDRDSEKILKDLKRKRKELTIYKRKEAEGSGDLEPERPKDA